MPACFITFEGTEGAGKSTQIQLLAERLRAHSCQVCCVREPGGTLAGERIRGVLKDPALAGAMSPEAELFLVSASRTELVQTVIRPALARGEIVLCDRFIDSTVAYQGFGRGLALDRLRELVDFSTGGLRPDLTFLLQVSLSSSYARRAQREQAATGQGGEADRFELAGDDFFSRVERGFGQLAADEPERLVTIDGEGSVDDVANRIWQTIERRNVLD